MARARIDQRSLSGIVELACRAPSVHNSQPWHLVAADGVLRLFLDPHRTPHATDPSGRQATISCGILLHHLHVAAAAAGWQPHIDRFPNPNDLHHLATLDFHPREPVADGDSAQAAAILRRHTDRLPFTAPPDWPAVAITLRTAVDPGKAFLHLLDDSARPELAEASRLTELLRRNDSYYHAELRWWTAASESSDGIPYDALPGTEDRDRVGTAREFPVGGKAGRRPGVEQDQSRLAVLSTDGDSRREALDCGEALSALLLAATVSDLATCTLTHLTEFPASRDIIGRLTDPRLHPQVLVRVGCAPDDQLPATPRRPLAEVLEIRG